MHSQEGLISYASWEILNSLEEESMIDISKMSQSQRTKALHIAEVNLFDLKDKNEVNFLLPIVNDDVSLKVQHFDLDIARYLKHELPVQSVSGVAQGPRGQGSFYLMAGTDQFTGILGGYLKYGNKSFDIIPIKKNLVAIREVDLESFPDDQCPLNDDSNGNNQRNLLACSGNPCSSPTFKLVHIIPPDYTDWLDDEFGSDWFAKTVFNSLVIYSFRNAMQFSGYPNASMTYVSVNLDFDYESTTNPDIDDDLTTLSPDANAFMNTYNADVAVMITSVDYAGIRGQARCIGPGGNCRFAIAEAPAAIGPTWTYAHELAHCFGARHDRGWDNTGACQHAFRYATSGEDRSILHCLFDSHIQSGLSRGLRFSNPNIFVNGNATGTPADNNSFWIATEICFSLDVRPTQSLPEVLMENQHITEVKGFPNPTENILKIDLEKGVVINRYRIFNTQGELIFTRILPSSDRSLVVDVSDLHSGLYVLELEGDDHYYRKFIKQ